jgi:hypothetical protein
MKQSMERFTPVLLPLGHGNWARRIDNSAFRSIEGWIELQQFDEAANELVLADFWAFETFCR